MTIGTFQDVLLYHGRPDVLLGDINTRFAGIGGGRTHDAPADRCRVISGLQFRYGLKRLIPTQGADLISVDHAFAQSALPALCVARAAPFHTGHTAKPHPVGFKS